MKKPTRPCRIIADGGLITPCKNCGQYHKIGEGFTIKTPVEKWNLDYSHETPERRQFLAETCLEDIGILRAQLANAKTFREKARILGLIRKLTAILDALLEADTITSKNDMAEEWK